MRSLRRFIRRVTSLLTRQRDEDRLQSEIEHHIALQTDDNIQSGMSPAEARRQAILRFGPIEATKDAYRDGQRLPLVETLTRDVRHALRRLRLAPVFATTAIATLALGIGATTTIFTLVHAVLLKSLPVTNPGELYRVGKEESQCCYLGGYSQSGGFTLVSYDLYTYLRDHTDGFAELAAFPAANRFFGIRRVREGETARGYSGQFVSGNYFTTFGIRPYAGRLLTPADDVRGAAPAAVMSHRLWQQTYQSDPAIVGSVFTVNGNPFTVVGISPPGFFGAKLGSNPPDFFLPLNVEPLVVADADLTKYDTHWLHMIGRVRPGVDWPRIEAQMRVALAQWLRSHWDEMNAADRARLPEQTLFLSPGDAGITSLRQQYDHWLRILMLASGFVLLIVCANVANLMLLRGMQRRAHTALSMALGARASRVVTPPVVESVALSLFGGALGVAIAYLGTRLILNAAFPTIPGLGGVPIDASPSIPVLIFALVTSVATGIVFGMAPAWMAAHVDPIEAIRGSARTTTAGRILPGKTLIACQAALSLVLLSASGLLTLALQRLETQDLGVAADSRIVARIDPRLGGYTVARLPTLYQRLHDAVASIPGVASVGLALYSPQASNVWAAAVAVDGRPEPGPNDDVRAWWNLVGAGFFDVVGNPIVQGRGISTQDTASSPSVAVVNQAFARKFFRGADPIGKRFRIHDGPSGGYEVVGIAKDARYVPYEIGRPVGSLFFVAAAQADYTQATQGSLYLQDIVVAPKDGARVSEAEIRRAVASVDPALPIMGVRTLEEQFGAQLTQQRLVARLMSVFGILALVIASVGLYGVVAYNVGRRVTELGVRMALGATRRDVITLVLRGALGPILIGLAIGFPLILAVGRFLGGQLYGVSPYDPGVTLLAILALGIAAAVACFVPALRASRVAPLLALRSE